MKRMELLTLEERLEVDTGDYQLHWYRHIAPYCAGLRVLDAGAGLGHGLALLREQGIDAIGCDAHRLTIDHVEHVPLENYPARAFDAVLAIDVLEHVEDGAGFVRQLARLARRWVFVTTPNVEISKCKNPFHVREYTVLELVRLLAGYGRLRQLWTSDAQLTITECGDAYDNLGALVYVDGI